MLGYNRRLVITAGPRQGVPASLHAPLAQLDRASGYEPGGRTFESCRAHQTLTGGLRPAGPPDTVPRSLLRHARSGPVVRFASLAHVTGLASLRSLASRHATGGSHRSARSRHATGARLAPLARLTPRPLRFARSATGRFAAPARVVPRPRRECRVIRIGSGGLRVRRAFAAIRACDPYIQATAGVAFDIYRFPALAAARQFADSRVPTTVTFPGNFRRCLPGPIHGGEWTQGPDRLY